MSSTSIGFRASKEALEKINDYMKEKKINRNKAINELILGNTSQPQLEQKEREGEDFFQYPPFLYCPLTHTWVSANILASKEGCKDCLDKKDCSAWNEKGAKTFRLPTSKSRSYKEAHTIEGIAGTQNMGIEW